MKAIQLIDEDGVIRQKREGVWQDMVPCPSAEEIEEFKRCSIAPDARELRAWLLLRKYNTDREIPGKYSG